MASERDPNVPEPGGTIVAIPRVPGSQPVAAVEPPEAGGTMVGFSPVARAQTPAATEDDSGQTVIGLRRLAIPPSGAAPRPPPGAASLSNRISPNFGSMAMPAPAPVAPSDGAGTMVGMGRIAIPQAPAAPMDAPEAGGTMVGMGRIAIPGRPAVPVDVPEAGGTMVGMGRVPMPPGRPAGFGPADAPEAGGTMVGVARIQAPGFVPPPGFGPVSELPEPGGTVVNMPVAGLQAQARAVRPSGPPPAYEIIKHLGGGDLGQVFHARHRENGAEVALRIIRPDLAAVPGAIDAARDVVALAQGAHHTHLGEQFELDETASPTIVSEFVHGRLLTSIMQERGLAPTGAVIDLGVRLCSALASAHSVGLAHGRVHAGNVMLEAKTGRWVLVDLGHGYVMQGLEPAHDLYALGAMLYEMATGHSAFEEGDTAVDPRRYVPSIPTTLAALLMRTLATDPGMWFPSALEMAQALSRARAQVTPAPQH